jgi:methylated-DNA-[protein]-cysteine S-methyltransferase
VRCLTPDDAPRVGQIVVDSCSENVAHSVTHETPVPMPHNSSVDFNTTFGVCTISWSDRGVTRLRLPDANRHADMNARTDFGTIPPEAAECMNRLRSYFAGAVVDFSDVPLDFTRLDADTLAIYQALRQVGWGRITTYGELAAAAGRPGAARAIGVAMARNPWPVIVPCHRVLGAGARLGGFSAPGGARTKERLLTLERVQAGDIQPMLPGLL